MMLMTAQRRAWLEPERSQTAGRLIELMVHELVDGSCQTIYYQQVSPISAMFSIAASEVLHCHCNCLHSHLKGTGHRCERPEVGTAAQVRGWCWAGFGISWNGTLALGQSLNHLGTEFQALWLAKVLTSSLAQTNQELFPDRIKSQVTLTNDQISGIIDQWPSFVFLISRPMRKLLALCSDNWRTWNGDSTAAAKTLRQRRRRFSGASWAGEFPAWCFEPLLFQVEGGGDGLVGQDPSCGGNREENQDPGGSRPSFGKQKCGSRPGSGKIGRASKANVRHHAGHHGTVNTMTSWHQTIHVVLSSGSNGSRTQTQRQEAQESIWCRSRLCWAKSRWSWCPSEFRHLWFWSNSHISFWTNIYPFKDWVLWAWYRLQDQAWSRSCWSEWELFWSSQCSTWQWS